MQEPQGVPNNAEQPARAASGKSIRMDDVSKFNGVNFTLWKKKLRYVLEAYDLEDALDAVKGAQMSPASLKKARAYISFALTNSQVASINDNATPWEIVNNLETQYQRKSVVARFRTIA